MERAQWFLPRRYVELTTLDAHTLAAIFVYPSLPERAVPEPADRPAALLDLFGQLPVARDAIHAVADHGDSRVIYAGDLAQATAPTWSRGRTVLLGDAAHALTPFSAPAAVRPCAALTSSPAPSPRTLI